MASSEDKITSDDAVPSATGNDGGEKARSETVVVEASEASYLASWPLAIVTFSLCLGTFLLALDINIIGVAVPKITAVFDSLDDVAWYGSAYLLTVTAFQPITGFIYKYFSVRATYLTSIIIFEGQDPGLPTTSSCRLLALDRLFVIDPMLIDVAQPAPFFALQPPALVLSSSVAQWPVLVRLGYSKELWLSLGILSKCREGLYSWAL